MSRRPPTRVHKRGTRSFASVARRQQKHVDHMQFVLDSKRGPGPLAPRARIIPLDHTASDMTYFKPGGSGGNSQMPKPSFSSDSTDVVLTALDAQSPLKSSPSGEVPPVDARGPLLRGEARAGPKLAKSADNLSYHNLVCRCCH